MKEEVLKVQYKTKEVEGSRDLKRVQEEEGKEKEQECELLMHK
jgi:hypothetical protein